MTELLLRFLFLVRFCCFMALVYLALHALCARLITRSNSKILWFFAVVTAPLTRPVRVWLPPDVPLARLLRVSLLLYGALWLLVIGMTHLVVRTLR